MTYIMPLGGEPTPYTPSTDHSSDTHTADDSSTNRPSGTTSNPPAPPKSQGSVTYTVQHGETLGELASRYGVSEQQILAANPQLRDPGQLGVGQQVVIPVMENGGKLPTRIQIQPGQTLTQISAQHGVSVNGLVAANGLTDPNAIPSGGNLWLPVEGTNDSGSNLNPAQNPFQPQMSAVDGTVKQFQSAGGTGQTGAQVTQAVENEIRARAQTELPNGQLPSDSILNSYGASIAERYGNAPGIQQAVPQAVANQRAAFAVDGALKQVNAAQQALNVAGKNAPASLQQNLTNAQNNLTSKVEAEIKTRAGLTTGQIPDAATVQKYSAVIAQRYANDPTAKAVNAAIATAPADFQAQGIVASAQAQKDPTKALADLNQAYAKASPAVQQAVLANSGAQAIIKNAANNATSPLRQVSPGGDMGQGYAVAQTLTNLDKSAAKLDPALAAALVNQALPQIEQYNTQFAAQHGGQSLTNDVQTVGQQTINAVMSLSGHLAGTAPGDQDVARLAKLGFWNTGMVDSAINNGASLAYPEAFAHQMIAAGQDPSIVVNLIQERVQADQRRVQSDVQALGQHSAGLAWLINNLGGSMTQAQLQKAITQYENTDGWTAENNRLTQQVITDSTTLTADLKGISSLAHDPQVANMISGAYNDKATSYGLALAAGKDPGLYSDSKGQSVLNVLSTLKLSDTGRKSAQLIGSLVLRSMVSDAVLGASSGPNSLNNAKAALDTLKAPWAWKLLGVDDQTVWNKAVDSLEKNLPDPNASWSVQEEKLGTLNKELNQLKALGAETTAGQLIRTVAVTYALANTINSGQKFWTAMQGSNAADQWIAGAQAVTAAAGLTQKVANLAKGLDVLKSPDRLAKMRNFIAQDSVNGAISIVSGLLDGVEGVRELGGLGEPQDIPAGVFSSMSGVGGVLYGASQFSGTDIGTKVFDSVGGTFFDEVPGGTVAASLGLVGVGLVAVSVVATWIYQQYKNDHQYEGAAKDFLQAGGYSPSAASALSKQGGLISGAQGSSGIPFLDKYAQMKHVSTPQLQHWVNSLTPAQLQQLDGCLLQTAGDSHGDVNQFTNGPEQEGIVASSDGGAVIPLANTLGVFESNLKSSGVPLPP